LIAASIHLSRCGEDDAPLRSGAGHTATGLAAVSKISPLLSALAEKRSESCGVHNFDAQAPNKEQKKNRVDSKR
jgi:hypothetical protein